MSRRVLVAVAAALALGVAGCGGYGQSSGASAAASSSTASSTTAPSTTGSSSAGSATASSSAALCAAASRLRASITALQQVDVVKQGTDAAQAAFATVKQDIDALADTARAHYAPQVAQVQADRAAVQAALDAAKAAPNAQTLGALRAAAQKLVKDVQALLTSIGPAC